MGGSIVTAFFGADWEFLQVHGPGEVADDGSDTL